MCPTLTFVMDSHKFMSRELLELRNWKCSPLDLVLGRLEGGWGGGGGGGGGLAQ